MLSEARFAKAANVGLICSMISSFHPSEFQNSSLLLFRQMFEFEFPMGTNVPMIFSDVGETYIGRLEQCGGDQVIQTMFGLNFFSATTLILLVVQANAVYHCMS